MHFYIGLEPRPAECTECYREQTRV